MRVSEPLVCHHCWPTRPNWYEACPHAKEVIDRVYVGRPVSALENELDSRSDECFELRQDVKRLEGEANELRAQLARTASGYAALVAVAREIRDLGTWSATEEGDLVLTCSDGSTEISYLATRASVVARALTTLAEVGRG